MLLAGLANADQHVIKAFLDEAVQVESTSRAKPTIWPSGPTNGR